MIWCRRFARADDYRPALTRINEACASSRYTLSKDFQCIGVSIGEAAEAPELAHEYFATAADTAHFIRDTLFGGGYSPMDALRAVIDEQWPAGASVGRSAGRMMLPHVIRRWEGGGQAHPHIDQCDTPVLADLDLDRRFGVNIYLEVPPDTGGGELELWDLVLRDERRYEAGKRDDYGLPRETLTPPDWVLPPGRGDLIIFDAARVHAVRPLRTGERVVLAGFLGMRSRDAPLALFA